MENSALESLESPLECVVQRRGSSRVPDLMVKLKWNPVGSLANRRPRIHVRSENIVAVRTIIGTDIETSQLGLGTHSLHWLARQARQDLLTHAYELGIRYLDTAPLYGAGLAEREIGHFARGRRDRLVITTKFGIPVNTTLSRIPGASTALSAARLIVRRLRRGAGRGNLPRDFSAAAALQSVERSLRALRSDYIDILYLHAPTLGALGDPEALADALEELRQAGRIRYCGVSGTRRECTEVAAAHPRLAQIVQMDLFGEHAAPGYPHPQQAPNVAVSLWELPRVDAEHLSPARLQARLSEMRRTAPESVLLLSTRRESALSAASEWVAGSDLESRRRSRGPVH
jgi:hypothetical protein